jgi:hypothetical protein
MQTRSSRHALGVVGVQGDVIVGSVLPPVGRDYGVGVGRRRAGLGPLQRGAGEDEAAHGRRHAGGVERPRLGALGDQGVELGVEERRRPVEGRPGPARGGFFGHD